MKDRILDALNHHFNQPVFDYILEDYLEISDQDKAGFYHTLSDLEAEGFVVATKKKKYGTPEMFDMVIGKVDIAQRGFGFLIVEGEKGNDIFLPEPELEGVFQGDRLLVKIVRKNADGKRREGAVVKVLKRSTEQVVGTFRLYKKYGLVEPQDPKVGTNFYVHLANTNQAMDGDIVVLKVTDWPKNSKIPGGVIVEVLGRKGDPYVDILSVIRKFNLPEAFPKAVEDYVAAIPEDLDAAELERRSDLRNELVITIDGADAKDLDDAISIDQLENGNFVLGVHIADVTHYVKEGTVLDQDAFDRGTSVYMVDKVVPMLPQKLSNGLCSLHPDVDRLTLSVDMEITPGGDVVKHEIYESVISSKYRMIYTDVSDLLEDKASPEIVEKFAALLPELKVYEGLAKILRKRRMDRGAIDFNFAEAKIITDENGKAIDVVIDERRVANRMIEEFMLIANETVAEHFSRKDFPFVYRIHEDPDEEKIETFIKYLYNLGVKVKIGKDGIEPKIVQEILEQIEGHKEEHVVNKLMLRSLKQAKYSPLNGGHFGLAAEYYCHFTSPIRRYPDLQIHRIIKESLNGKLSERRIAALRKIVEAASIQSSERERFAEQAERDADDMKKAEYLSAFVGNTFSGLISSVLGFGFFVELPNTCEGLVHISSLDALDDFNYDENTMALVGVRTRKRFGIGDLVEVKLTRVDVDQRQVDFHYLQHLEVKEN
jgi:ribonuclease R